MGTRKITVSAILLVCTATVSAQWAAPDWQLSDTELEDRAISLQRIVSGTPALPRESGDLLQRPRLSVALESGNRMRAFNGSDRPAISWSLDAWEMNTASLAHIQCSRAVRSIEHFLVEDCRFVNGPLPQPSTNLVQLSGQWLATPTLALGASVYSGQQPGPAPLLQTQPIDTTTGLPGTREQIDGVNLNLSFGLDLGSIGNLLLDLQVDRYRQRPEFFTSWYAVDATGGSAMLSPWLSATAIDLGIDTQMSGELGIGWRGRNFGADLTGQYRELPYWFGEELQGEGFHSFDIEFSWRAPARSSISVGVSNVLNSLPGQVDRGGEPTLETAIDSIYGRIPYVRYKHDL